MDNQAMTPAQLRQVIALSEILLSNIPLDEMLHRFANALKSFFDVTEVYIVLYDRERDMLVPAAASDPLHETYRRLKLDVTRDTPSITRHVMETGEPENVRDVDTCPYIARPIAHMFPTRSMLAVPLVGGNRPLGAILLGESRTYRSFSADEVAHARNLARYIALAIQYARVHTTALRRAEDLERLHTLAVDLMTLHNPRQIIRRVVKELEVYFVEDYIVIYRLNPYSDQTEVLEIGGRAQEYADALLKVGWVEELEGGLVSAALQTGQTQYAEDVSRDPRFVPFFPKIRSELVVPLLARGEVVGAINIESQVQAAFPAPVRRWVETVAATYGEALENAYLYADLEHLIEQRQQALTELLRRDQQKDEFIENLTHEMKNALTFVRGYTEILEDDLAGMLDESQRRAFQIVNRRIQDLVALVSDVLQLQRGTFDKSAHEPVDIRDLIETCVLGARPTAEEKRLHILLRLPPSLPKVNGNPHRLRQVLDNLLSNAIKFTPPGRTITVSARATNGCVRIMVADEGIGIPPEALERIFERFYQTEEGRKRRGAGVGLAISKHIVEAHGGRIWAESEVGKGSTFFIELPALQEAVPDNDRARQGGE